MTYYGTLTVIKEGGLPSIQIESDNSDVEIIISRLIPLHEKFPFAVTAHTENARLIRMVMNEYPLKITTPEAWEELEAEIEKEKQIALDLQTLEPVDPPERYFVGKLLPFQRLGLDFLLKTDGKALLADEMGLGKTIQTLAFVAQRPESMPVVVVAPLVTLQNWKREIEKFLRVDVDGGVAKPRIQIVRSGKQKLEPSDFYLINYEMTTKHVRSLKKINPRLVVFDEVQNLRNPVTLKFKSSADLAYHDSVRYRLGLSGTPVYNRGLEMYSIANVIKPGMLGERDEFIVKYCNVWHSNSTSDEKKDILANTLKRSLMLRRRKTEVLPDLPEKNRLQQNIQIDIELYEEQLLKLYEKIRAAKAELGSSATPDESKERLFKLNKHVREMRIAERQIAGLAKAPHIVDYITSLLEDYEDEKFVVFCHHLAVHQVLYDGLWKFNPVQVIGNQSDETRQNAIDRFQSDPECRIIICGLRAGNVGINLTSAAYVIFTELDWSPAIHRQAEDRLHRIGQKRTVFSHYLIGTGTFDEVLARTLVDKTIEISSVVGDKVESLNNKKAIEMLEERFELKSGLIAKELRTRGARKE